MQIGYAFFAGWSVECTVELYARLSSVGMPSSVDRDFLLPSQIIFAETRGETVERARVPAGGCDEDVKTLLLPCKPMAGGRRSNGG